MAKLFKIIKVVRSCYEVDGPLLVKLREEMGFNQSKFAEAIKVSKPFLCDIEKGRRTVSQRTLDKIQAVLKGDKNDK